MRSPYVGIKLFNGFPEDPNVIGLSDRAFRVLIELWLDHMPEMSASVRRELEQQGFIVDGYLMLPNYLVRHGPRVTARPAIDPALRKAIYDRDGWRCLQCGTDKDLSLDHIWPWSAGGETTMENLQTLCRPCNSSKGARV